MVRQEMGGCMALKIVRGEFNCFKQRGMKVVAFFLLFVFLSACQNAAEKQGALTDYSVSDSAYIAAYDRKFSKASDRQGWSQAAQIAWSRGSAAQFCGVAFDKKIYLNKLVKQFPDIDRITHDLNGLQWHLLQIRNAGQGFCTEERKSEIARILSS